jgi:hypothetical protein
MTNEQLIETAKKIITAISECEPGKLIEYEAADCLRLFCERMETQSELVIEPDHSKIPWPIEARWYAVGPDVFARSIDKQGNVFLHYMQTYESSQEQPCGWDIGDKLVGFIDDMSKIDWLKSVEYNPSLIKEKRIDSVKAEFLFEIKDLDDALYTAYEKFTKFAPNDLRTLCIDSEGHSLAQGLCYQNVHNLGTYPVRVYKLARVPLFKKY